MSDNLIYGYSVPQDGTGVSDEILASDQYQMISITIDSATVYGSAVNLPRGMVLQYNSGTGKYTQVTGAGNSPTCVVLGEYVPNIDDGDVVAKAYYKGTFKTGKLLDASTLFDITQCQRLSVRDNF